MGFAQPLRHVLDRQPGRRLSMTVVEHHLVEELQALFRQAKRIWIVWQA